MIVMRRDFHKNPELGFAEFRTASLVASALDSAGWTVYVGIEAVQPEARLGVPDKTALNEAYEWALASGAVERFAQRMRGGLTGVVAVLHGTRPGPTIGFRFDMDALPISESSDAAHRPAAAGFRSLRNGIMHACGHDGHTAIGVELGRHLADRNFAGVVKLIFEPAEEGGRGGAALVAAGATHGIDLLICPHLGLGIPSGEMAPATKGLLANTKLRARFIGRSSHAAAAPQDGRNALLGAATALLNLHAMGTFAGEDTRVNVGMLTGGTASNIVPDEAVMLLETRADSEEVNGELERRARAIISGAADMHELTVDVEIVGKVKGARISPRAARQLAEAAQRDLVVLPDHYMGASDDATALMNSVQEHGGDATYSIFGASLYGPHHTPSFDFDESAMRTVVSVLERLVRDSPTTGETTSVV